MSAASTALISEVAALLYKLRLDDMPSVAAGLFAPSYEALDGEGRAVYEGRAVEVLLIVTGHVREWRK